MLGDGKAEDAVYQDSRSDPGGPVRRVHDLHRAADVRGRIRLGGDCRERNITDRRRNPGGPRRHIIKKGGELIKISPSIMKKIL